MMSYTTQWLDEPEPIHPEGTTGMAILIGIVLFIACLMARR